MTSPETTHTTTQAKTETSNFIFVLRNNKTASYISFTVPVLEKTINDRTYTITKKGWYSMPRKGYTSVSIPDEMIAEIDKKIQNKKLGYSSRANFIKDAIRRTL